MNNNSKSPMKRTKIICTLGPACDSEEILKKMIDCGMNAARFNFSHGSHNEHRARLERFLKVREEAGVPVATILDTKGPEIRTGNIQERLMLEEGQKYCLRCEDAEGDENEIAVTYHSLCKEVRPGSVILIDDGKIRMTVENIEGTAINCRVDAGGVLSSHKGVNVPGVHVGMEYLSPRDREDILFGIKNNFNYIAASFIRNGQDVRDLRSFLDENGGGDIGIISKIENQEGLDNFQEILKLSDGIMVARGDMGVEIDYSGLPGIQKRIIRQCNSQGKIVITATQMLDSMMERPMPTRAEITDVANAVFDGSSGVMLSGETAAGKYPALTVETMSRIVLQAEKDTDYRMKGEEFHHESIGTGNPAHALGHAACTMADDIGAKALAAVTASGHTARMMAKFRPVQPIIGVTPYVNVYHSMSLIWGVIPVMDTTEEDWALLRQTALNAVRRLGIAETGDYVISSAGIPFNIKGNTNILRVDKII
ncbi:MAG: pyruvate kinase [Lentihominibacter sp.]|nr:pyruvate kinase [Bacillota bacterium]MDD6979361.1 pyruvate kinase [Bacillota bacterium]MDD7130405.1 pyruvate kinase [Bacillota bacterium]MDY6173986.1 pyruvate kinase [Lentihominibacter sp.]